MSEDVKLSDSQKLADDNAGGAEASDQSARNDAESNDPATDGHAEQHGANDRDRPNDEGAGSGDDGDHGDAAADASGERSDRAVAEPSGEGAERDWPPFAATYPDDPELSRLVEAFVAGDYLTVREGAPKLAEKSENPKVRRAAQELRQRIDPDPLARYLLWISIALLGALIVYAYTHGH